MRIRTILFAWLIFPCVADCPLVAQTAAGVEFSVSVADSVKATPIAGANVVLIHDQGTGQDLPVSGRTDAGGIFAGRLPSAEIYLLTVRRNGYRMPGGGFGIRFEVRAGAANETKVEMLPLGVIAGRVLDQYGDPVRHAVVNLQDRVTAPGQGTYYQSSSAAITDDRGEYRIADVEPGAHYIAAELSSTIAERDAGIRSIYHWPQTGGLVLYPDAADIGQAQQVEIAAGAVLQLNDLHLKIQPAVTISGKIQIPPGASGPQLSVRRAEGLALHFSPLVQGVAVEPDGSFRSDALPGKYILTASDSKTGMESKPLAIEVGEKDVTGLELAMTSGYEIRGRFAIDGRESIDFSKFHLNFGGLQVKIDSSGVFRSSLPGGTGRYTLQGLPDDWFVESVSIAGKPLGGRQISIEPGSTDVVFTLNPRGASVSIRPQGAGSDAVAMVALLRDSGEPADPESILGAPADGSGIFTVRSVPPGAYRIFTLDATSYMLLMRPDVLLEKNRQMAPLINVIEGDRKELNSPVLKLQSE